MGEIVARALVKYTKAIEQAKAAKHKRQWTAWQACLLDFVESLEKSEQRIKELKRERGEAVRDRDELWCRALATVLHTREIEAVTKVFNMIRPDAARAAGGGGDE